MEPNDEIFERQKLVPNDGEAEEEPIQSQGVAEKSETTPSPPADVSKINIKCISSGETTRSRNSVSCSLERTISDKGQPTKVTYVNERRPRLQMHSAGDQRFEFKSRPRKLLNATTTTETPSSESIDRENYKSNSKQSLNSITLVGSDYISSASTLKPTDESPNKRQRPELKTTILFANAHSDAFDNRPINHSFVSEVPDVKHMERALLGLLDDFHSGKLKAFGSGCTMAQMTKIREQQESLAKLHFEVAAAEEDALEQSNDFNASRAQENMLQLMQRLEQLSISIEQLQTNHSVL